MSQLNAHAKAVSEILFHPDRPENLFTCSGSGELWHWNNAQHSKLSLGKFHNKNIFFKLVTNYHFFLDPTNTHWLNTIGTNGKVNVTSLYSAMHKPINTIDIDKSTLLFGCDNEAMYIIRNIPL